MTDHEYMQHALSLAKKAKGFTSPNPCVGALVVKNDTIIGQGFHRAAGLPHAEVEAIDDAGPDYFAADQRALENADPPKPDCQYTFCAELVDLMVGIHRSITNESNN